LGVYCDGCIGNLEQAVLGLNVFIYFWFPVNLNVYFTVGSHHRGFVVLRIDWVFIVLGVMEIL